MVNGERVVTPMSAPRRAIRRISWGAVFAGIVSVLVVQLLLLLLGAGIGMVAIGKGEQESWAAVGAGATVWWIITSIIAGFIGAMVAARLANVPNRLDGTLNGLISWGTAQLVALYLAATTMGALLGGATQLLASGMEAAGETAERPGTYGYVEPGPGARDTAQQPRQEAQQLGEQARQQAEEVGRQAQEVIEGRSPEAQRKAEQTAQTAGAVALGTLAMLLLSGGAAAVGGYLGTPHNYSDVEDIEVRT